jgi:general secretion pathway protein B
MSFILDALKKSETDRQLQTETDFTAVPSRSRERRPPKWLWILAALLIINVVVLASILMRPDAPTNSTAETPLPANEPPAAKPTFEEQIAVARQNQPQRITKAASVPGPNTARTGTTVAVSRTVVPTRILTIDEVRLHGTLQLTELHLDIHVYSDTPDERFVFINMAKHREGSKLEEGPVVIEIRPDGVVLEHQGTIFLLPRE